MMNVSMGTYVRKIKYGHTVLAMSDFRALISVALLQSQRECIKRHKELYQSHSEVEEKRSVHPRASSIHHQRQRD